jgi:membrane-associated protease RseP (regulator of RpoE activity)
MKNNLPVRLLLSTVVVFAGWSQVEAQSVFERFGQRFSPDEAESTAPAAAPSSSYIGLVGDDRGTGGRGVRVLTVRAGSPAEKAGLRAGDLISGIGNQAVRSVADMAGVVASARPGEAMELTVERGSERTLLTVVPTLRPPPDDAGPAAPSVESLPAPRPVPAPRASTEPVDGRAYLGIRVAPLDPTTRRDVPLLVRRGVVIQTVDFGSPAERAGLPVGGVIVSFDGRRIGSAEDLVAAMGAARPGQEVEIMYYVQRAAQRKRVTLAGHTAVDGGGAPPPNSTLPPLVPPTRDGAGLGPEPPPPADVPPAGRLLPGGDLPPAVREVERVIGDILRSGDRPPARAPEGDVAAMKAEIAALKDQVRELQQRLAEMERRLTAGEPEE